MNYCQTYNRVSEPVDVSTDSGVLDEPVSLEYLKNYARQSGFSFDTAGVSLQQSITATLVQGQASVTVPELIGNVIISLTRDGTGYSQAVAPSNLKFSFNSITGTITFNVVGNTGGEDLAISYGVSLQAPGTNAFVTDDELLKDLITAAREALEKWTGRSLVNHLWKVRVDNYIGDAELPYSNDAAITSVENLDGEMVSTFTTYDEPFIILRTPLYEGMTVQYQVTDPKVPKALKIAICIEALYRYENRGDLEQEGDLSKKAMSKAASFKRVSTWLA